MALRMQRVSVLILLLASGCAPTAQPMDSPTPGAAATSPIATIAPSADPTATPSAPPTLSPTATPVLPTPAARPFDEFVAGRIQRQPATGLDVASDAVQFRGRYFATSSDGQAILVSADGLDWSPIDLPDQGGDAPKGVVASDSTLIAWSSYSIWFSSDGVTWQAADRLPIADAEAAWIAAIANWGQGFVAVGALEPEICASCIGWAAAWHSADGVAWQLADERPESMELTALVSSPNLLVARGPWDEGIPPKGLHLSSDGLAWHKLPDLFSCDDIDDEGCYRGFSGLVGGSRIFALEAAYVGWEDDDDHLESVAMWELDRDLLVNRTSDVLVSPAGFERILWESVVETAEGYVLVGNGRRIADGADVALAWASPDGFAWQQVDLPEPEGSARSVGVFDNRIVIAGFDSDGGSVVWVTGGR